MLTVNIESEFDPAVLKRSIANLETAVSSDANNTRYRKVLSEAYLAARRFQDALDQLEIVWQEDPDPRVAYLVAFASFRLGNIRQAEKFIAHASADDTVGFSRLHELKGHTAMERHEYADAVNEFSKAMILKPNAANAKWLMAKALVKFATEATEDCAPLFRRALSLLKDMDVQAGHKEEWHENLGRIYLALHHPVEALRHLERCQQSKSAEKSMLLGLAYLLHGNKENATGYLREAATNQAVRPQCISYLEEIAMTPRHLLKKMGLQTSDTGIPLFLDHEYLGEILGPGAEEIGHLIQSATHPRSDLMDRTQAEVNPEARKFGRLLAPGDQHQDKQTSPNVNPESNEVTTEKPTGGKDPEAMAKTTGDRLFPQTLLEMPILEPTKKLKKSDLDFLDKTSDEPPTLSDDDWDIGLDDAFEFNDDKTLDPPRTEGFDQEEEGKQS